MSLLRVAAVFTTNSRKVEEIRRAFDPYGIVVGAIRPSERVTTVDEAAAEFFRSPTTVAETIALPKPLDRYRIVPLVVMQEQTQLLDAVTQRIITDIDSLPILTAVRHHSMLVAVTSTRRMTFFANVSGYLDPSHRQDGCFGWDDTFLVRDLNMTYLDLQRHHVKISARDNTVGQLLKAIVHYVKPKDLYHTPQNPTSCVNFSMDPASFILSCPEYRLREGSIFNIPVRALNNGFFFRSATNRRENLYWAPGMNAGIPFVPKPKDVMHERVFMFHDMSHFLMPDLVFTGPGKSEALTRRVYITARLVSEAITLILGDMSFVDAMLEEGLSYPTHEARRIYPLFARMKTRIAELGDEGIYKVLQGSVGYCFRRDFGVWRELMTDGEPSNEAMVERFSDKYDAYFLEDFRWTRLNYNNMLRDVDHRATWWANMSAVTASMERLEGGALDLFTVKEWIKMHGLREDMGPEELTQRVFDGMFTRYIAPILREGHVEEMLPQPVRQLKSFVRYMLGQSRIFFRYASLLPTSLGYWKTIENALKVLIERTREGQATDQDFTKIREFYNIYVDLLQQHSLISLDDAHVYKGIYPLFSPVICDYDHLEEAEALDAFVHKMLHA